MFMSLFKINKLLIITIFMIAINTFGSVQAWTGSGHRHVSMIAWSRMTPEAQEMAYTLLKSGIDAPNTPCDESSFVNLPTPRDVFVGAASWLDCARSTPPEEAHVMHADRTQLCPNTNVPTGCKDKHCASDALNQAIADLNNKNNSVKTRRIALKLIIHLMGDLHQPLHAAEAADPIHNGGTTTVLTDPQSNPIILHQYWDYNVIQNLSNHKAHINSLIVTHASEWGKGSIDDWVRQTVEQVPNAVYREPLRSVMCDPSKMTRPVLLTPEYIAAASDFADLKIAQAGVRLALILNRAASQH